MNWHQQVDAENSVKMSGKEIGDFEEEGRRAINELSRNGFKIFFIALRVTHEMNAAMTS